MLVPKNENHRSQFSLRSLLLFTSFACVALVLLIPLVGIVSKVGLYFAPSYLLGKAFEPCALILFFASPLLLTAIGLLLYLRKPRPVLVSVFLGAVSLAVLQIIGTWLDTSLLYEFARVASPVLLMISLGSVAEVAIRQLKSHYVTCGLTVPIGLAYWLMTSLIIAAV